MIRIGKNKVRTGCFTCKRRRVKCDEEFPHCARCRKAGKICEGYADRARTTGANEPVRFVVYTPHAPVLSPSEQPDLDVSERRALTYFRDRTALELAGAFQTTFWLETILPLAKHESSLRNAIIALSSMHEHFSAIDHYSPADGFDFALNHYGRAMREVAYSSRAGAGQTSENALVTCSLFSTFESLQGHYNEACKHALHGMRILAEEQRRASTSPRPRQAPGLVQREVLARFFISTGRQILELGDPTCEGSREDLRYTRSSIPLPEKFTSHENAIIHIEILLAEIVEYCDRADNLLSDGQVSEDVGAELTTDFQRIKEHFEHWKVAFDELSSSEANEFSAETPESVSPTSSVPLLDRTNSCQPRNPALLILKTHYALITALLARVEHNDEGVFDEYNVECWTAVNTAEEFIHATSTYVKPVPRRTTSASGSEILPLSSAGTIRPTFSLAMGVVPILFLIASRTLDPALRQKALHLLHTCNRREGLWDSRLTGRLVSRMLELKELASRLQSEPDDPSENAEIDPSLLTMSSSEGIHLRTRGVPLHGQCMKGNLVEVVEPLFAGSLLSETTAGCTDIPHSSNSSETPEPANAFEFKLLDVDFLPAGRTFFRYTFVQTGFEEAGAQYPNLCLNPDAAKGGRLFAREYWEEVK